MFPDFFKYKFREVKSFLRIMKGKVTHDDQERIAGVNDALKNMQDEKAVYQKEEQDAYNGIDPDTKRYQPDQESGRDISAI